MLAPDTAAMHIGLTGPSLLLLQIVLSHFARSTEDLGVLESFAHRQLRTTMDVICSPSIEFIHGGLDKQVTHHLFPRLPRHNLRAATLLVKEFCREQELEFAEYKFVEGNLQVLSVVRTRPSLRKPLLRLS